MIAIKAVPGTLLQNILAGQANSQHGVSMGFYRQFACTRWAVGGTAIPTHAPADKIRHQIAAEQSILFRLEGTSVDD
jgi:hypothetical protein